MRRISRFLGSDPTRPPPHSSRSAEPSPSSQPRSNLRCTRIHLDRCNGVRLTAQTLQLPNPSKGS
jgi:hypothetical protein